MKTLDTGSLFVPLLIVVLICLGFWQRRQASNPRTLSEEEWEPYLKTLDLVKENRVRKQWLSSLVAFGIFHFLGVCFHLLANRNELIPQEGARGVTLFLFCLGIVAIGVILGLYVGYYFAYKKRGTIWLLFPLVGVPLQEMLSLLSGDYLRVYASKNPLAWAITLSFLAVEIYYWMNCLRLYRVNKARKHQRQLALKAKYDD